jgi:uncharacterized protein YciI
MVDHPEPGAGLLRRDYWLVLSTPATTTAPDDIERELAAHLAWLLKLEDAGAVVMSGPLTSGPGTGPGSGMTVLRAESAEHARRIADSDPFVTAGLRTAEVFGWRVNEGAISVRVSLGTGTYVWD